jgi:hypothetical protein
MNMNYRLLIQKTYAAFLMVLVVTAFSFANVVATGTTTQNTDGQVTSFGFNNPTVVSGLRILEESGASNFVVTTSLSHASNHQLQFDIRDIDGFDHLDVYVVLYKSNTKTTDSGLALQYLNSGVSDEALVLRWISPERSVYLSGLTQAPVNEQFLFPLTSGVDNFLVKSGTTALINSYNSGLDEFFTSGVFNAQELVTWNIDGELPSLELESGIVSVYSGNTVTSSGVRIIKRQVTIPITISKVLPQSGVLNYSVIVYDRLQQETDTSKTGEVFGYHADNGTSYGVQFYGEISITSANTVVFSGVQAGSGLFQNSEGTITAQFISNNLYKQSFSSDTTWLPNVVTTGLPEFAYLVPASGLLSSILISTRDPGDFLSSEGNRFALQAFRVSIGGSGEETTPVDLLLNVSDQDKVISSGATRLSGGSVYAQSRTDYTAMQSETSIISTGSRTSEVGEESVFRFQIKLSPVFQTNHILNGVVQTTQYTGTIRLLISNG